MEKPENITNLDFSLLQKMYPNNMDEIIAKLNNNYPVQYLIGYVNFCGYQIRVDERVLIPRFETEGLVDETIKLIKNKNIQPKIIEIGSGSGCISIVLSKELNTHIDAIGISKNAIDLASINAQENNADITFKNLDIKNCDLNKAYNVLISNPPYVSPEEEVDQETKYEPQNAIFAKDGLEFYKIILKRSKELLYEKNIIAFEIGCLQKEAIAALAKYYYTTATIIAKKDLAGKDRYLFIIND